jgi:hypothetical protein
LELGIKDLVATDADDLSSIASNVSDIFTGVSIPEPIKKNLFKALSQLCSAAVSIPVAYLEGKADEIKAGTSARVKIISATGEKIAEQIKIDPAYVQIAQEKFTKKVVREQINLDKICQIAIEDIGNSAHDTKTDHGKAPPINEDWLNHFQKEASLKTTEEMRLHFGKLLSAEIRKPGTFSLKTISTLSDLDSATAQSFVGLCSLAISIKHESFDDSRVVSLGGNASNNSLKKYGLSFSELNNLLEHGLIISDLHSWRDYGFSIVDEDNKVALPFIYASKMWALESKLKHKTCKLHGVAFSKVGRELLTIIDISPREEYTSELKTFFQSIGFNMMPVAV